MKRIYIFLISLLIANTSLGQSVTGVYVPQYISYGAEKVPYAYRATISGLTGNTTYRYYNRFVTKDDTTTSSINAGAGNYMIVKPTGGFVRVTSASLSIAGRYGEFTTDGAGSYTGWFMNETTTSSTFNPGDAIYIRMYLNDGTTSGTIKYRIALPDMPIKVIDFGTTSTTGTRIRSTPAASGVAQNFVMLYDNTTGTGRPIAGTVLEADLVANTTGNAFAPFYASNVNEVDRAWGTIIPNNLPDGIKKIVQYGLASGLKVGSKSSSTGIWAKDGGGTLNTVNFDGSDILVLDGTAVPLGLPLSQSISFNAPSAKTYGDIDFDPGATASSGLPVTYTSSDPNVATVINGNTIHIVGAGTVNITASQPGDDDFLVATDVMHPLTVNKAALTIKADDQFWVPGNPMPPLTLSFITFVNGDDVSKLNPQPIVTTTATPTSPLGQYPITVSSAGSPNYTISFQPGIMNIQSNQQPQTITFNPFPTKVYGAADFDPGATASSLLPVNYTSSDPNIATITANNKIHIERAGTVTITAKCTGNPSYLDAMPVDQVLTVAKAPLTITADNKTRLLNQSNPGFTVTYKGFVLGETDAALTSKPVVTSAATTSSPAGTYPITPSNAQSDKYDITYVNGVLTISPLSAQTITFGSLNSKKYGDVDFRAGATTSSGLPVTYQSSNTNVAVILNDRDIHIVGVGTTIITASQPGNLTFAPAPDVTQTFTVQKASLTIRANDYTKNEGEPNPSFTVTYTGFVNGDDSSKLATAPVVNSVATASSVAGTYRIAVQGATSNNYSINQQNGNLTVLPAQGDGQDNVYAYISSPGQLQLNIYVVNAAKVATQVFDLNGSRLVNTTVTLNKGFNSSRIPVGNLAPGIYNIRVAGNGVMLKTKVVIR